MGKWLIKYYPVEPAQSLTVWNLDVLDVKNYCSKIYQEMIREELAEYEFAIARHGFPSDGIVRYNNKNMRIISADKISDALDEFFSISQKFHRLL